MTSETVVDVLKLANEYCGALPDPQRVIVSQALARIAAAHAREVGEWKGIAEALQREVARLASDAARYRWLRGEGVMVNSVAIGCAGSVYQEDALDYAIDAAMPRVEVEG